MQETWSLSPADWTNSVSAAANPATGLHAVNLVAAAALSTAGKKLFDDIRAAHGYISGEVPNANGSTSGAWGFNKYFIAFVGAPSNSMPWLLQLCGHHIAYNISSMRLTSRR